MRLIQRLVVVLALPIIQFCGPVSQAQPKAFLLDPQVLEGVRTSIQSGSKEYAAALKALRKEAEKALAVHPGSVVDKKRASPSGDRHDYMSLAPYWWPDPAAAEGSPYIRRDGEVNPETKDFSDKVNLWQVLNTVTTLSYAWYFFGDTQYSDRAVQTLRMWFVDPPTRMNPNLNYAQAIPGHNNGRGAGIIDTHQFPELIDAIGVLSESPSFTGADREGLVRWFREYLEWLTVSKNGKDECNAPNNHGTWYDVQAVSVALFVGDAVRARSVLTQSLEKRIALQIEPDGRMPKELARTRSLHYSLFNLAALTELAILGERVGVDLWHFETKDGRSIRKVVDHLRPYVAGEQPWTGKQISEVKLSNAYPLYLEAARVFHDNTYSDAAAKIPDAETTAQSLMLLRGTR